MDGRGTTVFGDFGQPTPDRLRVRLAAVRRAGRPRRCRQRFFVPRPQKVRPVLVGVVDSFPYRRRRFRVLTLCRYRFHVRVLFENQQTVHRERRSDRRVPTAAAAK